MTGPGRTETPALEKLLRDGTLAGDWTLDAARSEVRLHTTHLWGFLKIDAVFRQVDGAGTVSTTGDVTGTLRVTADSIDSKNAARDQRARSADFLEVTTYPYITFAAAAASVTADDHVRVTGELTVHGVTRLLSFYAQVTAAATEVQLDGEIEINRADFGMTLNKLNLVAWESKVMIRAVFTRQ